MHEGALMRLKKMAGSSTALELLDRFLEESPDRLASCVEALAESDFDKIQVHMHRIRNDAGWLGATQVHELAGVGETKAVERVHDGMAELLEQLSGLCYQVCQDLERQRTLLLGSKEF